MPGEVTKRRLLRQSRLLEPPRIMIQAARLPLATVLAVSVVHSFSPMLGLLLFALGLAVIGIWATAMAVRIMIAAWRRMWHDAALAFVALLCIWPCARLLFMAGDYVHLALMCPFYASRISTCIEQGASQASFGWGGTGFAGVADSQRSLVYDNTGRLAHETGSSPSPEEPAVLATTEHLVGKFYIIEPTW